MIEDIKTITQKMPCFECQTIMLRKINVSDYKEMFEYASDEQVSVYLPWEPHPDKHYTKKFIKQAINRYKTGEFFDWGICYTDSDNIQRFIGTCGFTHIDKENSVGEIGYVISRKYWNKGIATKILKMLIYYGFNILDLNRIEARYEIKNKASLRVMINNRMQEEGILRENMYFKNEFHNIGVCSILKGDYIMSNTSDNYIHPDFDRQTNTYIFY